MSEPTEGRTTWKCFTYYREEGRGPFPRTFATALRGHHSGQTSLEPALFHAGSANSIFQQPLNIRIVLDLMSNAETNHSVNQALAIVLFDHLGHEDREVADFAAQTLARLEERYYGWIQLAENTLKSYTGDSLEPAEQLAELYFAFAELQSFNPMLRGYYLRKLLKIDNDRCGTASVSVSADGCLDTQLPLLRVRALIELERLDEAESELRRDGLESTQDGLWLLAEKAYRRHDLDSVRNYVDKAIELQRKHGMPLATWHQAAGEQWGVL